MEKVLGWVVFIILGLFAARLISHRNTVVRPPSPRRRGGAQARGAGTMPEEMVRCAHCGIHLPRSDAYLMGGKTWCSQEHAKLGQRNQTEARP